MIDKLVETTLNVLNVPVSRTFNANKQPKFIYWQYITSLPADYADDDSTTLRHTLRVHIFSKTNYATLLEQTITELKKAGFVISSIDSEIYEEETNYFHRPITIYYMEE